MRTKRERIALPLWLAFGLILIGTLLPSSAADLGRWILVTAPGLRPEMEPLVQHRRKEGFNVEVVVTTNVLSSKEIAEGDGTRLRKFLTQKAERSAIPVYVLLAGAVHVSDPRTATYFTVPSLRGEVARMRGRLSDYGYGMPGEDRKPCIVVGRLPARTMEEAWGMVQKTLRFEQDNLPGSWRNRLLLVIGNPGGGALAEMFVQQVLGPRLAMMDPSWRVETLFNVGSSRYFVPANQFGEITKRRLAEGEVFSVYLGHSGPEAMWSMENFMTRGDWGRLKIPRGGGVFVTCGCFACQVEGREGDGFGVTAVRNPAGPVAVIGASGESYSAPGQLAAEGLLKCLAKAPFLPRLGDYWLAVQAGLAQGNIDDQTFKLYDQFDGSGGKVPLAVQRVEHLEMWMLLGDPALRLPLVPLSIALNVSESVQSGKRVLVKGEVSKRMKDAKVSVSLERPLNSTPLGLEKLPDDRSENTEQRERVALENNRRANDLVLSVAETKVTREKFSCELQAPSNLPWSNLVVRAVAMTDKEMEMGVVRLKVEERRGR